jgi:hypothetical protein
MTSFKYKPNKIKYLDEITTLDSKHKEVATKFKTDKDDLEEKHTKKNELMKQLKKLDSTKDKELDLNIIKKKGDIRRELNELTEQIEDIEKSTNEINYYKEVSTLIIDYYNENKEDSQSNDTKSNDTKSQEIEEKVELKEEFDTLDKLNEISKQKRKPKRNTKKRMKAPPTNRKTILDFYGMNNKTETEDSKMLNKVKSAKNKATLFEQYMGTIDTGYNTEKLRYLPMCVTCNQEKLLLQSEGMYVCTSCGEFENVIIESDIPNYKDQLQEKPAYILWVRRTGECGFVRIRFQFLTLF